jgi:hypothetical protein
MRRKRASFLRKNALQIVYSFNQRNAERLRVFVRYSRRAGVVGVTLSSLPQPDFGSTKKRKRQA